jgi:hypothetical protein
MSYAVIVRKKIRMCARFGHLPRPEASRRAAHSHFRPWYYCHRCGALIPLLDGGAR